MGKDKGVELANISCSAGLARLSCMSQTNHHQQIGSGGEDKPQLMQKRQKYCATDHPLQSTVLAWWPLPVEAHAESVSSSIVVFAHPPVQNGDSRVFDVIVTVIGYGNEKGAFPRDRHQSVNVIRSTKGTGSPACIPKKYISTNNIATANRNHTSIKEYLR